MESSGIRINKYIADAGICSRRGADELIASGKVTVNGHIAQTGEKISDHDQVCVDGKTVRPVSKKVYLAFHKPVGITCTADTKDERNVIDHINYPIRLTYCGRLDKDSEGLLLLTNDGDIINRIMKASAYHEKEYIVKVDKPVTKGFLRQMSEGVYLEELDVTTRPCRVEALKERESFRIILTQGLNRQIRRMCDALGFHVKALKRVRIMNIRLGNLKTGEYRELTQAELRELKSQLKPLKGIKHG
ncbi:MAG: pseudouridine synthase [Lachnospiraceae bacterium]|nr:pseudouridine synthase [Lachnospiraceae bacterium]